MRKALVAFPSESTSPWGEVARDAGEGDALQRTTLRAHPCCAPLTLPSPTGEGILSSYRPKPRRASCASLRPPAGRGLRVGCLRDAQASSYLESRPSLPDATRCT